MSEPEENGGKRPAQASTGEIREGSRIRVVAGPEIVVATIGGVR